MPLPAYMTEAPKINPTDVLTRQIRNIGLEVDLIRAGNTLTLKGIECTGDNDDAIARALKLLASHADSNHLSIDAIVYPVQGAMIARYERAGFMVHTTPSDLDDPEAYTLLRRAARN